MARAEATITVHLDGATEQIANILRTWNQAPPWQRSGVASVAPALATAIETARAALEGGSYRGGSAPGMIADDCTWCQHHGYTPGQKLTSDGVPIEP